jgi:hypothetical protein
MFLILGALVTVTALFIVPRLLGTRAEGPYANLGCMSDQWLAQHRRGWDSTPH